MIDIAQIRIRKINHAFLKIECDTDIALELSEAFKFQVQGFRFMPSYKMGKFDGYIRLFNVGSRTIGSGLLLKVINFCTNRDYSYEVIENPHYVQSLITKDEVISYMDSLNLHARGELLEIRDYQVNGVYTALKEQKCVLLSCTGCMCPSTEIEVALTEDDIKILNAFRNSK